MDGWSGGGVCFAGPSGASGASGLAGPTEAY